LLPLRRNKQVAEEKPCRGFIYLLGDVEIIFIFPLIDLNILMDVNETGKILSSDGC